MQGGQIFSAGARPPQSSLIRYPKHRKHFLQATVNLISLVVPTRLQQNCALSI